MWRKINVTTSLKFGTIAAVLFGIPTLIYILDTRYSESWLLYLGSMLFFITISVYTLYFNKAREGNANTVTMVFASHVTTIIGVILSCVICFIMLSLLIPGYLDAGVTAKVSPDTPPNSIQDKTNGLSFRVFMGASIINFSFGSFAGLILPFYSKRNQTKDSGSPYPLHQKGQSGQFE